MPSSPSLHAWRNTTSPGSSMCSLSSKPALAWRSCLAALDGFAAQIVAVKLDQIKGVEEDALVIAPVAQPVEYWQAIIVASYGLAIDQARRGLERERRRRARGGGGASRFSAGNSGHWTDNQPFAELTPPLYFCFDYAIRPLPAKPSPVQNSAGPNENSAHNGRRAGITGALGRLATSPRNGGGARSDAVARVHGPMAGRMQTDAAELPAQR
jgi:hypothetical protein